MLIYKNKRLYFNGSYLCCIESIPKGRYTLVNKYCQEAKRHLTSIEELGLFIGKDIKVGRMDDSGFRPVDTYKMIIFHIVRDSGKQTLWIDG